jgi:hypothetical protein
MVAIMVGIAQESPQTHRIARVSYHSRRRDGNSWILAGVTLAGERRGGLRLRSNSTLTHRLKGDGDSDGAAGWRA